jgi:hypothetical protein
LPDLYDDEKLEQRERQLLDALRELAEARKEIKRLKFHEVRSVNAGKTIPMLCDVANDWKARYDMLESERDQLRARVENVALKLKTWCVSDIDCAGEIEQIADSLLAPLAEKFLDEAEAPDEDEDEYGPR